MNVLIISPGYPADMPEFTRGLAASGARVIGVGDQGPGALPALVRHSLDEYIQVRSLWNTGDVIAEVRAELRGTNLDRIECLWEPGIMLAAELRQHFGVPGLSVEQAHRFRDKEAMKIALDAAGIRTPEARRCRQRCRVLGSRRSNRISTDPETDCRCRISRYLPC